jgi:hypothetical protein
MAFGTESRGLLADRTIFRLGVALAVIIAARRIITCIVLALLTLLLVGRRLALRRNWLVLRVFPPVVFHGR